MISTPRESGNDVAGEPVGGFPIGPKMFNSAAKMGWATSSEDILKIGYLTLVVDVDAVRLSSCVDVLLDVGGSIDLT